jgi:hypothetical protein
MRVFGHMMLDIQSIVGTSASALAIIAGVLALVDRWVSRRQPPAPVSLTSPSGLILLSRPLPPPRKAGAPALLRRATRIALVTVAWIVSFVAGVNLFVLTVALLAPVYPRLAQAAAASEVAVSAIAPVDALGMIILTNFVSLFVFTRSGWPRRGALIALAAGFLLPNADLWFWLLHG